MPTNDGPPSLPEAGRRASAGGENHASHAEARRYAEAAENYGGRRENFVSPFLLPFSAASALSAPPRETRCCGARPGAASESGTMCLAHWSIVA
jgi:hypothetical protein